MLEKMIFKFGKGGVIVYKDWLNRHVELVQIKPPLGYVGGGYLNENDLDDKEELYRVKIKGELLNVIKNDLLNVSEPTILKYDDFIFDFSDYNEQSVNILLNAINEAIRGHSQLSVAC